MVLKKNLPVTTSSVFDFTVPRRNHSYQYRMVLKKKLARYNIICLRLHNSPPKSQLSIADGIKKKTCPLQQHLSSTSQFPARILAGPRKRLMIRECLYRVSFLEKSILPMRRSVLNGPLGPWALGPGPRAQDKGS